jgi:hypothetical protein
MTEAQFEGTTSPEAMPVEGTVPEADVLEGATTGPEDPMSPEITEEVHDDTLPDSSIVVRSRKSKMRNQSVWHRC